VTIVFKDVIPATTRSITYVGKEVRNPAGGHVAAVGLFRLVNGLPKFPRWMSVCRQDKLVQNRAETGDPPSQAECLDDLDAGANAFPVIQRALDCDSRYSANAVHRIREIAREAIHESHFAGGANCRRRGRKIANQSFMQYWFGRLPDLGGELSDRAFETCQT
jgi:hypothetical protein